MLIITELLSSSAQQLNQGQVLEHTFIRSRPHFRCWHFATCRGTQIMSAHWGNNHPSLWWFFNKVKRLWLAALKRRSQTARLSWEKFIQFVARFFPPIVTISLIYIGPFLNRSKFAEQLACGGLFLQKSLDVP